MQRIRAQSQGATQKHSKKKQETGSRNSEEPIKEEGDSCSREEYDLEQDGYRKENTRLSDKLEKVTKRELMPSSSEEENEEVGKKKAEEEKEMPRSGVCSQAAVKKKKMKEKK